MGPHDRSACKTSDPVGHLDGRWAVEALRGTLQALHPGLLVEVVEEIGSTNAALLADLRAPSVGASPRPCLLVAERQTAGRGRLGRTWHAQPGASLTFSLAMPLSQPDLSGLSLAVGVALAQTLDPSTLGSDGRLALKWPNDLWLRDPGAEGGGRKLGGILIETTSGNAGRWAVIGVGLNILPQAQGDFATGQAWLREIDPLATPASTLARAAAALLTALVAFEHHGLDAFHDGFRQRDLLQGQQVTTTLPAVPEGLAEGIDPTGRLRVRGVDGRLHAVQSGEVSVRPTRPSAGRTHHPGDVVQMRRPC